MRLILLIIIIFAAVSFPQNYSDSLKVIEDQFKSFQYPEVIKTSISLLKNKDIPREAEIRINLLKAISHFALNEDTLAKYSFIEILKRDSSFIPDTVNTSPKIISFFNSVRQEFFRGITDKEPGNRIIPPALFANYEKSMRQYNQRVRTGITRSLIFPGLGHIYFGDRKGWYLAASGGIAALSSVYFIINTELRRDEYMKENRPVEVTKKYNLYNASYKVRNFSIGFFAAVWIFSQFDLLSSGIPDPPFLESVHVIASPLETGIGFRIPL